MESVEELFHKWLMSYDVEDILEQNDIDPVDAIMFLWKHGQIELPTWLEVEIENVIRSGEEED